MGEHHINALWNLTFRSEHAFLEERDSLHPDVFDPMRMWYAVTRAR